MIDKLTSEILFRCPCCQKLYCTESTVFEGEVISSISGRKVEFECEDCGSGFYLESKISEQGTYQTSKKSKYEFSKCPKCDTLKAHRQDECPNCGVLESKYEVAKDLESSKLYNLKQTWSMALADFENDELHQKFISEAQKEQALSYAFKNYLNLKEHVGADPLVDKYLKQIELRLSSSLQHDFIEDDSLEKFSSKYKQSGFSNFSIQHLFLGISGLAILIFMINVLRPQYPQLNGLLIAASVLGLGLWLVAKSEKAG